ncbi:phosphatase PAP2 family protein [Maribellus mangrovi]|uniref:phosphatase PAP2 family protein n=1 Tax=Maribellus mangrovi TaxID=3133146 RepID=UPI0030EF6E21
MKRETGILLLLIASLIIVCGSSRAGEPLKFSGGEFSTVLKKAELFHNDSIHVLNFKYADRKRGFKPYIAPTVLIAGGTALHFSDSKYQFNDWVQDNFHYEGGADDYLRFAPLAAVYSLNAIGIKGENNFGNLTAISLKSFILNDLLVYSLKKAVNEERPNGGQHSFPSGHTSVVFAFAQIMHHEYGEQSIWYSVGAYSCAATVGLMRIAKGAHWASDVLAGAGIGMLSTELVYLTHQYKWDWEHIKHFDIFPFSVGQQKGLTLVYNF